MIFVFLASLGWFIFGAVADIRSSLMFWTHGQTESNAFTRDKYRNYDLTKGIIYYAAIGGGLAVAAGVFTPIAGAVIAAGWGTAAFFTAKGQKKHSLEFRERQLVIIAAIQKAIVDGTNPGDPLNGLTIVTRYDRTNYVLFPFLYSTMPMPDAAGDVASKVVEWAKNGARFPE